MICPKCGNMKLTRLPDGRLLCRNKRCQYVFEQQKKPEGKK